MLAAGPTPLPGALNWWRPAAGDIEDGLVGMPTRVPAFARWTPALYVGTVVPGCKSTRAGLKALPPGEKPWMDSSKNVRQESVA